MDFVGFVTFTRTYARKINPENPNSRVETWDEAINRIIVACDRQLHVGFTASEEKEVYDMMFQLKALVAGRFLWQLGTETVDRLGLLSLQNCAFCIIDTPVRPFTWTMDCLMLGSGVGFNLAPEHLNKLPVVKPIQIKVERLDSKDADFIVPDSREGWVKLLGKVLKAHFYSGKSFSYSTTLLRSSGAAIKGFGGSASGPEILCKGMQAINNVLNESAGRKLRSVDALDIMNIIGMIVVAGNVRRSAQIALSVAQDTFFLRAKRWDLGNIPNWRCNSNNSILCNHIDELSAEFWTGYQGNGEPYGLINLPLSKACGRLNERQYPDPDVEGYNPCAEQSLNNFETCALGELVLPRIESKEELFRCAQLLYRVIKHSLRLPCHHPETEAIVHKNMRMGIGITGYLQATEEQRSWLSETYVRLRQYDVEYSHSHGWPTSIKLTTVKPSGTLSLLAGCTAGVHPGYARQYIRRIRFAAESPLVPLCRSHGYHVEFVRQFDGSLDHSTVVVQFPYKLPNTAIVASEVTALDQLNFVKRLQTEWSDNSVSCCLVGNTLIHTDKGFRYLAEICKKGRVLPQPSQRGAPTRFNSPLIYSGDLDDSLRAQEGQFYSHKMEVVTAEGSLLRSNAYYHNGYSLTVKLFLGNGARLEGTKTHKVQVIDEATQTIVWRPLEDLTLGTFVVSRLGLNIWPDSKKYVINNLCVKLDYWTSVFAVNMMPNFHYCENTSEVFFEKTQEWLDSWKDCDSHGLEHVLQTKWGSLYRGVPKFVLQGSKEVVIQYISMVWFLTHNLHKDKAEFMLNCPYRTAAVLQTLLTNLGVAVDIVPSKQVESRFHLAVRGRDAIDYMLTLFTRELSPFEERVVLSVHPTFFEKELSPRYPSLSIPLTGYLPNMGFREMFRDNVLPYMVSKEFERRMTAVCRHHDPNLDRQTLAQFVDLGQGQSFTVDDQFLHPTFMFHKITHIHLGHAPQQTFDISVPVSNSYLVQSGVVSHNTVYYRREELPAIQQWLSENYENNVKTCSFLLHSEHGFDQAPLEEITIERYNEMVNSSRTFDLSSNSVENTQEDDLLEVECAGGACPIR
jgi:ribonucleoside-triphosphate reductase